MEGEKVHLTGKDENVETASLVESEGNLFLMREHLVIFQDAKYDFSERY